MLPRRVSTRTTQFLNKVPVLVSELDLECQLWIKLRLAPLPPNVGTISLAFVGRPTVRVQLAPYNRVRLMRIPILQVGVPGTMPSTSPAIHLCPPHVRSYPPGLLHPHATCATSCTSKPDSGA